MKISIALPTYEMRPYGDSFVDFSLEKICNQTYKNIEVVISDHSEDDKIMNIAKKWSNKIDISYIRKNYNTKCPSDNMNVAIKNCTGDYIKLLFQDDFLYNDSSIDNTVKYINNNPGCKWLVSTSEHSNDGYNFYRTLRPRWNDDMWKGHNSISSPSVTTIKNDDEKLLFDEKLIWLMDCDYYQRYYNKYGMPIIIDDITVVNRTWQNQLTNLMSDWEKSQEYHIVREKFMNI
jgi:glycosyltransferase involved in cell wall biosynthesis